MKKTFNLYIVAWAVVLALFNIVSFLSVLGMRDGEFTTSFWIGYAAITIALIGQLICAYVSFKANSAKKMFYNRCRKKLILKGRQKWKTFTSLIIPLSSTSSQLCVTRTPPRRTSESFLTRSLCSWATRSQEIFLSRT